MDQSWIETAGRLSLYFFLVCVSASLIAMVIRAAFRRSHSSSTSHWPTPEGSRSELDGQWAVGRSQEAPQTVGRSLARFFLEYVGNISISEHDARRPQSGDRRYNRQARLLMDHIKQEMMRREVSPSETEKLMEELRVAIREGPGYPG